jgi:peptidoglycan/LPS O-acetylase OafA/YrhL
MERDAAPGRSDASRLAGLDGLRGIAACVVAFGFHSQFMFAADAFPAHWAGPAGSWLHDLGWTTVDLFFVLSGFVFAHVCAAGDDLRTRAGQGRFWAARFARLYPLHLAMLLITALIFRLAPHNTGQTFSAHLLMLQVLVAPVGQSFDGPSWSISVEMLCYALFAAGAMAGRRIATGLAGAAVLAGLFGLMAFPASAELTTGSAISRGLLGFFTGQLLWRFRMAGMKLPVPLLYGGALIGLTLSMAVSAPVLVLSLLAWPALVLASLRSAFLASRPLRWLGDRSYAIYLLHAPIIDGVRASTNGLEGSLFNLVAGHAGLMAATLVTADLVYRRFELPARTAIRSAWADRATARQAINA